MHLLLNLSVKEISTLLRYVADESELHEKIVGGLGEHDLNRCYTNTLGFGPSVIPHNWVFRGYHPYDISENMTIKEAIESNRKIQAIKILRSNTDLGLKESKDIIESIM